MADKYPRIDTRVKDLEAKVVQLDSDIDNAVSTAVSTAAKNAASTFLSKNGGGTVTGNLKVTGTITGSLSGNVSGNATSATTASKVGSSTVGGVARPVYNKAGAITACTGNVGSATKPTYMKNGVITACDVITCVESWRDGYNWYRRYSDGFIEQGGRLTCRHKSITTVDFHKDFTTTQYHIESTVERDTSTDVGRTDDITLTTHGKYTGSCGLFAFDVGGNYYNAYFTWRACGW